MYSIIVFLAVLDTAPLKLPVFFQLIQKYGPDHPRCQGLSLPERKNAQSGVICYWLYRLSKLGSVCQIC